MSGISTMPWVIDPADLAESERVIRDLMQERDSLREANRKLAQDIDDLRTGQVRASTAPLIAERDAMLRRIQSIADDFVPQHERDAGAALEEMRDALNALLATPTPDDANAAARAAVAGPGFEEDYRRMMEMSSSEVVAEISAIHRAETAEAERDELRMEVERLKLREPCICDACNGQGAVNLDPDGDPDSETDCPACDGVGASWQEPRPDVVKPPESAR